MNIEPSPSDTPRNREELYRAIMRDVSQGISIRKISQRYATHRRTIRRAIACNGTPRTERRRRGSPKMDRIKPILEEILARETETGQPFSVRQIHRLVLQELGEEHGVSYSTIRGYVRQRTATTATTAAATQEDPA